MSRTLDPAAHAARRDAFLDATQRLIQSRGFAQLSIQDVIAEVAASKGAFYHYFDSKAALLDGVVSRMVEAATEAMAPVVADPDRSAVQKFDAIFSGLAAFKGERKSLLLEVLRVWLSDDNVIVREKLRRGATARMTPLMVSIIRQGETEGSFRTSSPEHAAEVFMALMMAANERATDVFFARQTEAMTFDEARRALGAFGEAFERILGARPGSLGFDRRFEATREWFEAPLLVPQSAPSSREASGGSA
jgi:AcrR family transcriptional regulator